MERLSAHPAPAAARSPYEAADLYDLALDSYQEDLDFWRAVAREAHGPVLEVGCGTGRVLLRLIADGADVDGVDLYPPMLDRLREKADAHGLKPRLVAGDMRDFTMPRRYRAVICAFNTFAHNLTPEDQLATLRCCREHLEPGGVFVMHMAYPSASYWLEPDGEPVLEMEVPHPLTGHPVRMFDTRTKDRVGQVQHSRIEIQELDGQGRVAASHWLETSQRWVYRFELELLLRLAGFPRCEMLGGFDRRPLTSDTDQIVAVARRD